MSKEQDNQHQHHAHEQPLTLHATDIVALILLAGLLVWIIFFRF